VFHVLHISDCIPDITQPKIVTKRDIQSKEKKTTHAISNQKTSVYIDHEPENIQGYILYN
jgi:hypothetical protein